MKRKQGKGKEQHRKRTNKPATVQEGLHAKNEVVTVDMIGLTHDGDGVGRTEQGFTLFIPHALPGERVEAKVLKSKKQYGYGKLLSHHSTSEQRIEPPCPIYAQCGGCQLQHYDYEAQLKWKRQHVIDSLTRIGKLKVAGETRLAEVASVLDESRRSNDGAGEQPRIDDNVAASSGEAYASARVVPDNERQAANEQELADSLLAAQDGSGANAELGIIVHDTIGMSDPWRYRNKAAVPIGLTADNGELVGGFYAKGSHRIIDMDNCLIQKDLNDEVIAIVKEIAKELHIQPYDEETASGVLRHVMTRIGVVTGEIMIVLITNTDKLPRKAEWIEQLRKRVPNVKSIVHNINNKVTNAIFGERTELLWGSEVIYDELDGLRFAISARSFYQVNPEQTVTLYRKAVEYAALTGKEQVIDAYCGIGSISLFLAREAKQVYGVEIVPEAIEDAKRNAALNGLDNTTFEAGPAEVVIPRWKQEGMNADVIVVDPPRKGCDPALLETILAIQPERVVYVSCNPSTLARDLRVLEDGGYRTVEVTPVDMFPQTGHVECVAWLVRE